MVKTKFFRADSEWELEGRINEFIQNKDIINVCYTAAECGYGYIHYCCVVYRE